MPIYDYRCEQCGDFSALRKMSEAGESVACVECGNEAVRVISAPYLALMDRNTRVANERNEKSAHAPKQVRRSSCGCSGTHTCKTSSTDSTKSAAQTKSNPNGLKMQTKKTARPWMLGH
ncbi:MAG: zinc ribbon domain-containing protein [Methylophaga sp.]|nr:zinc ribbon domain-containing protein [Methylophaga sp.]